MDRQTVDFLLDMSTNTLQKIIRELEAEDNDTCLSAEDSVTNDLIVGYLDTTRSIYRHKIYKEA